MSNTFNADLILRPAGVHCVLKRIRAERDVSDDVSRRVGAKIPGTLMVAARAVVFRTRIARSRDRTTVRAYRLSRVVGL